MLLYLKIELYLVLIFLCLIILRAYFREHRAFNKEFLIVLCSLVTLEIVDIIVLFFPFSTYFAFHHFIIILGLVLWVFLPYAALRFIIVRFSNEKYLSLYTVKFLLLTPILIIAILAVLSPYKQYLYRVNLFGEPVQGDYFFVINMVIAYYSTINFCLCIYKSIKKRNTEEKVNLVLISLYVITLTIAQIFYGDFSNNIFIILATTSVILIYILYQEDRIFIDTLTGINNRNRFRKYLSSVMNSYARASMYLTYVDIDDFKKINDDHGHIVGDLALRALAESMRDLKNKYHYFMARIGGDEFAIISSHNELSEVDTMLQDLKEVLRAKSQSSLPNIALDISYGSIHLNHNGVSTADIIKIADHNMYIQKTEKKDKKES